MCGGQIKEIYLKKRTVESLVQGKKGSFYSKTAVSQSIGWFVSCPSDFLLRGT